MLYQFLSSNLPELITRCSDKVAKRSVPFETLASYIDHGVPLFLPQVVETLRLEHTASAHPFAAEKMQFNADIPRVAGVHGTELFRRGYSLEQVVHEYGDVCQAVSELAGEEDECITTGEFCTLDRCLDSAIAGAITTYGQALQDLINDHEDTLEQRVRMFLAEERRLVDIAIHTSTVIRTGTFGQTGATGMLLMDVLEDLRILNEQTLTELDLAAFPSSPLPRRHPFLPFF